MFEISAHSFEILTNLSPVVKMDFKWIVKTAWVVGLVVLFLVFSEEKTAAAGTLVSLSSVLA